MKIRKLLTYGALYLGLILLFLAIGYALSDILITYQFNDPSYEIDISILIGLLSGGIILLFAGLIDWYNYFYKPKKEKQITKVQIVANKQSERYCPDCGRSIPFDAQLCPYCNKRF